MDALTGAGTISSGYTDANTFTFGVDNGSGTFSGVLADTSGYSGNYTKTGTGTQILTGANTFTGVTTITAGTLQIGDGGTTGSLASASIVNNADLTFNRSDALTYSGIISGTGNFTKSGAGTLTLTGANTFTGGTAITAGTLTLASTTASPDFTIASGATLDLNVASGRRDSSGNTTFSGAGTLAKTGDGTTQWGTTAATYALGSGGLIDVRAGKFNGGSGANENWTNNFADLNVADGATFEGGESNVHVDALTGAGTISSGFTGAGYATFTFGVDNGSGTFSGVLADTGGANIGHYTKAGTGTQILSGVNTYTGGTTITAGTLLVNSQIGNVEVLSGGTLGGSGTVGAITLKGGTLAPGNSPGSLTAASLDWEEGPIAFDLGPDVAGSDYLNITGALSGTGGSYLFAFQDAGWVEGQTYDLLGFGSRSLAIDEFGFANGGGFDGAFAYNDKTLQFTLSTIPEPGAVSLLFLALLAFLARSRRQARVLSFAPPRESC